MKTSGLRTQGTSRSRKDERPEGVNLGRSNPARSGAVAGRSDENAVNLVDPALMVKAASLSKEVKLAAHKSHPVYPKTTKRNTVRLETFLITNRMLC